MDISGLRFRKLKLKDGTIRVDAEQVDDFEDFARSVSLKTKEQPLPTLTQAVDALLKEGLSMLAAPDQWRADARLSGISVNYEGDDRMGVVVTILIPLDGFNAPLVVNTPHLRQQLEDDEGGTFMSDNLASVVEDVAREAMKFLSGERAQADMFRNAA